MVNMNGVKNHKESRIYYDYHLTRDVLKLLLNIHCDSVGALRLFRLYPRQPLTTKLIFMSSSWSHNRFLSSLPAMGPYQLLNAKVPIGALLPAHPLKPKKVHTLKADVEGLCLVNIGVSGDGILTDIQHVSDHHHEHALVGGPNIDLQGRIIFPRLAELHAHIDKTQTWERAPNLDGSYSGAKTGAKGDRKTPWSEDDVYRRMSFAMACAYAHGTRSLRTHIDSQKKRTQPSWKIFDQVRREWAGKVTLQGVVSLGVGKIMGPYGDKLARLAATYGAHFGPVIYPSKQQKTEIIRAFELAERYGLPLDFHVDETLDPTANGLEKIANIAIERGFTNSIVCGHVCSLALKDDEEIAAILSRVKQANIGIVALPMSNLYLQDRALKNAPLFRGTAPMKDIFNAGVYLSLGGDNVRDAFHPYGDFDMVEVYREAVRIGHLDNSIGQYANCISHNPEKLMGLENPSIFSPGQKADMIVFSGTSFSQIFSRLGAPRQIINAGRLIEATLPDFPVEL